MNQTIQKIFLVLLLCLSTTINLLAQEFNLESVPNPKEQGNSYISDPTNVFSALDVKTINNIIASIEGDNTMQIAVVMLPSIGNTNPKYFATDLFNKWGIGQANNNGLMLLTVLDQRRTEFETGYRTEAILPDVVCNQILQKQIVPNFKQEKFSKGIIASLQRIKQIALKPTNTNYIKSSDKVSKPQRAKKQIPSYVNHTVGIENPKETILKDPNEGKEYPLALEILLYLFILYLLLNIIFHYFYFSARLKAKAKSAKQDLHNQYIAINKIHWKFPCVFFPLPHYFIYQRTEKYLKHLREAPRYSKTNGMLLIRLNSENEKIYLEKKQITEEEIGSVDYDVWITEDESDVLILRYDEYFSKYKECTQCKSKAYYKVYSKIVKEETNFNSGLREEHYECKNCNLSETKEIVIPQKLVPLDFSFLSSNKRRRGFNKRSIFNEDPKEYGTTRNIFDEEPNEDGNSRSIFDKDSNEESFNDNFFNKNNSSPKEDWSGRISTSSDHDNDDDDSNSWGGGSSGGGGAGASW